MRTDSDESDAPIDLPLREQEAVPEPEPAMVLDTVAAREMAPSRAGGSGFAVGMLALGLLAGFGGGFLVGQRLAVPPPPRAVDVPRPGAPAAAGDAAIASRPAPIETTATPQMVLAPPVAPVQHVPDPPVVDAPVRVQEPVVEAPRPAPKPRPAPPVVRTGTVRFDSRPPGATIYLNEVRLGVTPLTLDKVTPGTHQVRMEMLGHDTWRSTVTVKEGEQHFVGASLE